MRFKKLSFYDVVVMASLTLIALIMIAPFYYVITVSITDPNHYKPLTFQLLPEKVSLAAYSFILRKPEFLTSLFNTVYVTVVGTSLNIAVTFTMAYALTKRGMPLYKLVSGIVIFTMLFNPGLIPNYLQVRALGLINKRWALILPGLTNAFNLIIARSFLDALPKDLEESAKLDGCNDLGVFFRIVMPLSTAVIATLTLFFAVGHWNAYYSATVYIRDTALRTLQVYVRSLIIEPSGTVFSEASDIHALPNETIRLASVVLAIIPILAVYPFAQRHFVKGVMLGSIKG